MPGDVVSINFREIGGTCVSDKRLDFMENSNEIIMRDAIIDIVPLILKYDKYIDPLWWKDSQEIDDLSDDLRSIYEILTYETPEYHYCGRYSVSLLLE